MAILTVLSETLNPSTGNLSSRFKAAVGFYIDAPLVSNEIEIDVFLQVYFPRVVGEKVRNLPLGKLSEGQLLLNQADTESLVTIPSEYIGSDLEMALFFLPSDTTRLEVFVIGANCTLCGIKTQLQRFEERVDDRFDSVELSLGNMRADLNLIKQLLLADVVNPVGNAPSANGVFKAKQPQENIVNAYFKGFL